jgi:hypothetical protein
MGFRERERETELAKAAWLLEMAERWHDRDSKFAELLRMKARPIDRSEDQNTNRPVRRQAE